MIILFWGELLDYGIVFLGNGFCFRFCYQEFMENSSMGELFALLKSIGDVRDYEAYILISHFCSCLFN